jgi:hypothetical protein
LWELEQFTKELQNLCSGEPPRAPQPPGANGSPHGDHAAQT